MTATPAAVILEPSVPAGGVSLRGVAGWLAVYFLIQALARVALGGGLQLDEAEQVLWAQDWQWGYGAQGPLYTWLVKGLFAVGGPGVWALALLKNALLWGTCVFTGLTARRVLGRTDAAAVAAVLWLLVPHFVWESQRDQSHLVLATCAAAAVLYFVVRLLQQPDALAYAGMGVTAAVGLLAKYNFALLLLGLVSAAATVPALRARARDPRLLLTLATLVLPVGPHVLWLWQHAERWQGATDSFATSTAATLAGALQDRLAGMGELALAILTFAVTPLLLGVVLARAPAGRTAPEPDGEAVRVLRRSLLGALGWSAVLVVGFGVTQIKPRWLQPLWAPWPVLLVVWFRGRLQPAATRRVLGVALAAALMASLALQGVVWGAGWLGRSHRINAPFATLAEALGAGGWKGGVLYATDRRLAGNLALHLPQTLSCIPPLDLPPDRAGQAWLVVWEAGGAPEPPPVLKQWVERFHGRWPAMAVRQLFAPGLRGDPGRWALAYLMLPPPAGEVRTSPARSVASRPSAD